ncbi:hypothetical protein ACQ4PT_065022 [Festuca glaucescens]
MALRRRAAGETPPVYETMNMTMVVPKFQYFTLYGDQPHLFDDIVLDDVAIVGSPSPPPVLSPKKSSKWQNTGTSSAADKYDDVVVDPSKPKIVKFSTFRLEDMTTPEFRMGMCFPTVNDLRKALNEYNIKNRTVVAYEKNDKQRVRVYCLGKPPCAWFLYAALDNRKNWSTNFAAAAKKKKGM